jgi:hypothetical protein
MSAIIALLLFCGSQTLVFASAETAFIAISRDEVDDIDLEEVVSVDPFLPSFGNRIKLPLQPLESGQVFVCLLPLIEYLLDSQYTAVNRVTIRKCVSQQALSNQPRWLLLCAILR